MIHFDFYMPYGCGACHIYTKCFQIIAKKTITIIYLLKLMQPIKKHLPLLEIRDSAGTNAIIVQKWTSH
jgi:hypothetical protein